MPDTEDRKLSAVGFYFEYVLNTPNLYMWASLPGGFLVGRPITFEEYVEKLMLQPDEEETPKQQRFFYLKDAYFIHSQKTIRIDVVQFDGLEISAWGRLDPASSTFLPSI